ncbi:MAG: sodium-dependent bicarbonate transport family permease [Ignavibacteriales bacterium]|nr:sodium-dependent bicarbonate transport family permease [Ignavibacteriales bacterium]MCF8304962.1 sodium-dependent bicarbonate transport family permease [Ignavibacteriales bacterium]MCF8314651.1 sodium-dependent bicarbonate transport family permease [Ignavibacteriales bacterium]MCF8436312.1 sodium-dependent bicarbonate transport family permease [Ignavibacteriales bacterium]
MDFSLISNNLLSAPILFFFLGVLSVAVKSNLNFPQPFPKILSLYLLFAIGFKGGIKLSAGSLDFQITMTLLAAVILSFLIPVFAFFILRMKLDVYNASAIAATYGSISAVTFLTATSFLSHINISFGGYLVAAMALMESPAIISGIMLLRFNTKMSNLSFSWSEVLKDAFLNGSVFLLLGSLLIGWVVGKERALPLEMFYDGLFNGILTIFLLDMGIVAAQRISDIRNSGFFLLLFGTLLPLVNFFIGLGLSLLLNLSQGDAFMFCVLAASASYIAVPAAMRISIPEANPSLYVSMSLAITFPFNIIVGLPLYYYIIGLVY